MQMKKSAILSVILLAGCLTSPAPHEYQPVQFALTGNTCPESPFKPHSADILKLIDSLNRENPTFIIHTGNIVYAGYSPGIRETDVTSQYKENTEIFSRLSRVCIFVPGEFDNFNGSTNDFERYTKRPPFHSFGYGPIKFIVLNSTDPNVGEISSRQISWLKDELSVYGSSHEFVILSYHPFYLPKPVEGVKIIKNAPEIHDLFVKYHVIAVISGTGEKLFRTEKDGISYINAGCVPSFKPCYPGQFRYYTILLKNGNITIQGKVY
jgi:3',5'-cyclic AMP phosphodiesterase CpdA